MFLKRCHRQTQLSLRDPPPWGGEGEGSPACSCKNTLVSLRRERHVPREVLVRLIDSHPGLLLCYPIWKESIAKGNSLDNSVKCGHAGWALQWRHKLLAWGPRHQAGSRSERCVPQCWGRSIGQSRVWLCVAREHCLGFVCSLPSQMLQYVRMIGS